MRILIFTR